MGTVGDLRKWVLSCIVHTEAGYSEENSVKVEKLLEVLD